MKQITDLINQLSLTEYEERYPQVKQDGLIHLMYFHPYLNGTGLHRAITPSIHLNATTTHRSAITGISPWNIRGQELLQDMEIEFTDHMQKLVAWANYIVFPMYVHDIEPMLADFRQINPSVEFVMDIDDCIHEIPPGHPASGKYTKDVKDQFLKNMCLMNVVTGSTEILLDYYDPLIKGPDLFLLPNYISSMYRQPGIKKKPGKVRVGLVINPGQFADVNPMRKILQEVRSKIDFELVVLGWKGTTRSMHNCLGGVPHIYVPPVPVTDYFSTLAGLELDMAILPLQDNTFNRCKSHHKLLHYAMMGIPAVTANVRCYTDFIHDGGQHGAIGRLRAEVAADNRQWVDKMVRMATDPSYREEMAADNLKSVWQESSLDTEIMLWTDCFR